MAKNGEAAMAMAFLDPPLDKMVKLVTLLCLSLFAFNSYLQVLTNKNTVESSFTVACFLTTLVFVLTVLYGNSLSGSSHKGKSKAVKLLVFLFTLIAVGFLVRAFMVIPSESSWVIAAACAIPAITAVAFFSTRRWIVAVMESRK